LEGCVGKGVCAVVDTSLMPRLISAARCDNELQKTSRKRGVREQGRGQVGR